MTLDEFIKAGEEARQAAQEAFYLLDHKDIEQLDSHEVNLIHQYAVKLHKLTVAMKRDMEAP